MPGLRCLRLLLWLLLQLQLLLQATAEAACLWPKTGGRNEHLVAAVKRGRNALSTTWRGSYSGICAVMKLTAHMVALQERMAGPRYDCYGPWAMCPADIVAQFA